MLVDVVWFERIHDRCEYYYELRDILKVATLIHIWVDWLRAPGDRPVLSIWFATQAQRHHKIIHARNFRVQPQAIMGSGIVEYVA